MQTVVILRGTPSVGKTAIAEEVFRSRDDIALADGDALWRTKPFDPDGEAFRKGFRSNAGHVLRTYVRSGFRTILFTSYLPTETSVKLLLAELDGLDVRTRVVNVLADYDAWCVRVKERDPRAGTDREFFDAFQPGPYESLDTTGLSVEESAARLARLTESTPPEQRPRGA